MSEFTIKIVSHYPCLINEEKTRLTKTRIIFAERVDVDEFPDKYIVTIDDNDCFYEVPKYTSPEEDWKLEGGYNSAVYIENSKGKTTHIAKTYDLLAV